MSGNIRFTKEIVNDRIKSRGIAMIGEYANSITKTKFQCSHGHTWDATSGNVIHKTGCPVCNGGVGITKEIVTTRLLSRNIVMLGDYISAKSKTSFKCNEGHIWNTKPYIVFAGHGCPHCANRVTLTKEIINKRLHKRNINLIGEYTSSHTKTDFRCETGHVWSSTPDNIIRGNGCPYCALDYTKPASLYILKISDLNTQFTGFGISCNIDARLSVHRTNLNNYSKCVVKQKIFNLTRRDHALQLEQELKSSLPIFNSGVPGFITESTKLDFDKVVNFTQNHIIERGYDVR